MPARLCPAAGLPRQNSKTCGVYDVARAPNAGK